jgi:hypothetical protein
VTRGERVACLICEATFASIEALERHEAKKHPALTPRFCGGGCCRDLNRMDLDEIGATGGVCLECEEAHDRG